MRRTWRVGRSTALVPVMYHHEHRCSVSIHKTLHSVVSDIFNPLRPSGKYMNHMLWQSVMLHFVFIDFAWLSL
jgi:hypothetical protein